MKLKTNLIIDFAIFLSLLAALEPALTGIPIHEWFSLAFAGAIIVHLLLHWDWIVAVLGRFFRQFFHTSRLKLVVDVLLFVAFSAVMASGLLISRAVLPFLGIAEIRSPIMRPLHSFTADATLILVGVHFALSWTWVVHTVRRLVIDPLRSSLTRKAQPVPVLVEADQN